MNPGFRGIAVFLLLEIFSFSLQTLPGYALARSSKTFPITMSVDFGPAGKATHHSTLDVEKGTTPKEAVSQAFPIISGKSCCSLREVISIDGVRVDPAKRRWWTCWVNGSKNISPQNYKLRPGDRVEWKYIQD